MRRRSRTRTLALAAVALVVAASFLVRRTDLLGPTGPTFDPADYEDVPIVEAPDAGSVVGERAVVCGTVVNAVFAQTTGGQPTFLNLGRPFPNQPFDAVIWGRDRPRFDPPPELAYDGQRVCVAGEVTTHEDTPRIEVRVPAQIRRAGGAGVLRRRDPGFLVVAVPGRFRQEDLDSDFANLPVDELPDA